MKESKPSERITDTNIQRKVLPVQFLVSDDPSLAFLKCRVSKLHPKVEPENEKGKIEAGTKASTYSNIFIKIIPLKQGTGTFIIFCYCPYITSINKQSPINEPEELKPVFHISLKLYIGCFIRI